MTISYNIDIATTTTWSFLKILCRWRGSAWQNCAGEYVIWLAAYFVVRGIIRHEHLSPEWQRKFTDLVQHLDSKLVHIPLVLLLGFFVTFVVDRWKRIFANIGFIDEISFLVSAYVDGTDEEAVTVRRNILRYLCLSQVLLLRDIALPVRKRFPNLECLVDANILQKHESDMLQDKSTIEKYAIPINWACMLAVRMRKQGNIASDTLLNTLIKEINDFQRLLQNLCNYDWVPVPLAYPQVAFCVVRAYLAICLFARQYVTEQPGESKPTETVETIAMALMTMLQVFFYLAWVKVAEELLNPLGEDDDDLECNYIIDHNIMLAMRIADSHFRERPRQERDDFDSVVTPLYSEQSAYDPANGGYSGSVSGLILPNNIGSKNRTSARKSGTSADPLSAEANRKESMGFGATLKRRLTHPISFIQRIDDPQPAVPEDALEACASEEREEAHQQYPTQVAELRGNIVFAETLAYHPRSPKTEIELQSPRDEEPPPPLFARSTRFPEAPLNKDTSL